MADSSSDKTQDPTPRRRQQAREKGQIAYSQDLGSSLLLFVALLGLLYLGKRVITFFALLIQKQLGLAPQLSIDSDYVLATFQGVVGETATAYMPFLVLLFVAAILVSLLQTGILFNPDKLAPDISRLSLMKGLQRIFSITGFMKLGFGLFKVILVAIVASVAIYLRRQEIMALSGLEVSQIAGFLADISISTALWCSAVLLALAILDYAFQKWKHEQDLKMSEQEVRDEMKEMQGDPQMTARRRAVARQMVMNRVSDAVPNADVVITNPTELAVAIQYKPESMASPIVLAKGAGLIAQRIRRLALENNVPIVERKPLARLLFKEVEINEPIPDNTFKAVAEVLAYVYQLKGKPIPGSQDAA